MSTPRPRKFAPPHTDIAPPRKQAPINVTLPYPPTVNNLTSVVRGRKVKSAEGRQYLIAAEGRLVAARVRPLSGDVSVTMRFFRPKRCGDLDNVLKGPLDALTGFAYADDKQVRRIEAERDEDKDNPRVEVTVTPYESDMVIVGLKFGRDGWCEAIVEPSLAPSRPDGAGQTQGTSGGTR